MSFLLAVLAQASSSYLLTDEQFAPYRSCISASARLLVKDTPEGEIYRKAEANCFGERTAIALDLSGKALEQPGATSASRADFSDFYRREHRLHDEIDKCLSRPNPESIWKC